MHSSFCVALACLLTIGTQTTADAAGGQKTKLLPLKRDYTAYTLQRVSVRTGCFPARLKVILAHIARQTGRKPMITSGLRPHAGKSQHTRCFAADFRIPGISERKILAAAASAPGIGGIGRYCNGIVHVDVGPRRSWAHCR